MNNWLPWYVIAWRLLWALPFYFVFFILLFIVSCAWGQKEARRLWETVH